MCSLVTVDQFCQLYVKPKLKLDFLFRNGTLYICVSKWTIEGQLLSFVMLMNIHAVRNL